MQYIVVGAKESHWVPLRTWVPKYTYLQKHSLFRNSAFIATLCKAMPSAGASAPCALH